MPVDQFGLQPLPLPLPLPPEALELLEPLELPEATEPEHPESLEPLELPLPAEPEFELPELLEQPSLPALMPSRRAVPEAPLSWKRAVSVDF